MSPSQDLPVVDLFYFPNISRPNRVDKGHRLIESYAKLARTRQVVCFDSKDDFDVFKSLSSITSVAEVKDLYPRR